MLKRNVNKKPIRHAPCCRLYFEMHSLVHTCRPPALLFSKINEKLHTLKMEMRHDNIIMSKRSPENI